MSNTIEIHGFCDERFETVKEAFAENFRSGLDTGASLAATLNGKFIIDIWAGYRDAAKTQLWEEDTIVNVYSTTKVMTAICILKLVDRGLLDLDTPVAEYWPEFAQKGKQEIPVRFLLSHTAGLPGFKKQFPLEGLYDWDLIVSKLAAQKPWWKPGTKSGYHAITFGYLLGELVRRVSGKSIGNYFREEVAEPLNADFFIGLPEEHDGRVAELIPPKLPLFFRILSTKVFRKLFFWHPTVKVFSKPKQTSVSSFVAESKTRAWRAAEIPASNGHGNARSIARVGAVIACGGELDGVRLLSTSTLEKALEEQVAGKDHVMRVPLRFGLGFGLPSETMPLPNPRSLYWGGMGGSIALMDLDAKLSFGYTMNNMLMGTEEKLRIEKFRDTLYEALKEI